LLLFDPTDPHVRFGDLPSVLQASYGLVVSDTGGQLIKTPLMPASLSGIDRTTKLSLAEDGSVRGEVQEIRKGASAADLRGAWLNMSESDRKKGVQALLGRQNVSVELTGISATDLDVPDKNPVLSYRFRLVRYATLTGGLLLLKPALFEWAVDLTQNGERTEPVGSRPLPERPK